MLLWTGAGCQVVTCCYRSHGAMLLLRPQNKSGFMREGGRRQAAWTAGGKTLARHSGQFSVKWLLKILNVNTPTIYHQYVWITMGNHHGRPFASDLYATLTILRKCLAIHALPLNICMRMRMWSADSKPSDTLRREMITWIKVLLVVQLWILNTQGGNNLPISLLLFIMLLNSQRPSERYNSVFTTKDLLWLRRKKEILRQPQGRWFDPHIAEHV